jgi:uncharacterized membrane protein YfcA
MLAAGAFVLVALVAAAAGAQNAVAGGGTFLTFPTLLFAGLPARLANGTSTVGLWPASLAGTLAFRGDLRHERRTLVLFGAVSLVGGLAGALLLLFTPERTFRGLVPWLLLVATLVFALGPLATKRLRARGLHAPLWLLVVVQLAVAIYGGYFGAGIGILMLAALALLGMDDIHAMNGLKNLLAALINGVAVVTFVVAGLVEWPVALVMVAGSVVGGYAGARVSKRIDARYVRAFIITVGAVLSVYYFVHG